MGDFNIDFECPRTHIELSIVNKLKSYELAYIPLKDTHTYVRNLSEEI